MLGTPAVFLSPTGRGYTNVQEQEYGLVFNFSDIRQAEALDLVKNLVEKPRPKDYWQEKRRTLLDDAIDVTGWMVRMVECFGETRDPDGAASRALEEVKRGDP